MLPSLLISRYPSELLFAFHLLSTRTESVRLSIPRRRAQSVQWCMSHAALPESPPPVVRSHSFHCLHRVTACIKVADWRPNGERGRRQTERQLLCPLLIPERRLLCSGRSCPLPLLFDLPDRDQSENFLNGTSDRDSAGGLAYLIFCSWPPSSHPPKGEG